MNRHERRRSEAFARYKYKTKHGRPEVPPAVEEGKAKKRKRLLMTKQEKANNRGGQITEIPAKPGRDKVTGFGGVIGIITAMVKHLLMIGNKSYGGK
jgi:hypothetical protein